MPNEPESVTHGEARIMADFLPTRRMVRVMRAYITANEQHAADYASLLTCAQGLAEAVDNLTEDAERDLAAERLAGNIVKEAHAKGELYILRALAPALSAFESATKKETEPKQ